MHFYSNLLETASLNFPLIFIEFKASVIPTPDHRIAVAGGFLLVAIPVLSISPQPTNTFSIVALNAMILLDLFILCIKLYVAIILYARLKNTIVQVCKYSCSTLISMGQAYAGIR